jgi:superfamily II DNA or RNA helicase
MEELDVCTFSKTLNTYLGQKGYSIPKSELTLDEQILIRRHLVAKPFVPGAPGMGKGPSTIFPIYRESPQKFYVPRYFGERYFGPAKSNRLHSGDAADGLQFHGELRENQKPVVAAFMRHLSLESSGAGGGLLELPCAYGKTCIALYLCAALKKKTLVIVHKEFLMNQWIERIGQFLPGARVGKIQGQIFDIQDKDIVLGMLQSISMKDYDQDAFRSFGLTIIDEVHHISSEVFSCALFKLVTTYTLGLSATMNRKDGTTKVFKLFLGDVVYKGKRDDEHNVVVRAIEYKNSDEEFNEVKLDFRGNVQYSTLISKLCTFNPRTEFILRVIQDMINEDASQQMMLLAHNKNVLKYLHDAIVFRQIASVGYYIGGMKEGALKETESKRIVIATYSMASEALDIKTLTTLIMVTPKTDIEQAVGRILREKHGSPIVVDIIDSHGPFQNQWTKRKQFYKKQNYKIIQTSRYHADANHSSWKTVYEPGAKGGGKCRAAEEEDENDAGKGLFQGKCMLKLHKGSVAPKLKALF